MNKNIFGIIICLTLIISSISCHKEPLCVTCEAYKNDIAPVAIAGPDIIVKYNIQTCSFNDIILDASASFDPDGIIFNYNWRILSPKQISQQIYKKGAIISFPFHSEGEYIIELQVSDREGKYGLDTVKVIISNEVKTSRPNINLQIKQIATLPADLEGLSLVAAVGNKLVFEGSIYYSSHNYVYFYDISNSAWSKHKLSLPRTGFSTIAAGNKIFFAGGVYLNDYSENNVSENTVDIYDINTGTISVTNMTDARSGAIAILIGNKVCFAGGTQYSAEGFYTYLKSIEIYDLVSKTWTLHRTSNNIEGILSGVKSGDKMYFPGGSDFIASDIIEIFDPIANVWTNSKLNEPLRFASGIAFGNNIYWAGNTSYNSSSGKFVNYNLQTQQATFECLSEPIISGVNIISKNNKILVNINSNLNSEQGVKTVDIFDPISNNWFLGKFNVENQLNRFVSLGNEIYAINKNNLVRIDF